MFKETLGTISEKVKESEIAKKAADLTGDFAKQAQKAAENISKKTADLSQNVAFKKVTENVKVIKESIDEATQLSKITTYRTPKKLRKRSEFDEQASQKVYESNT